MLSATFILAINIPVPTHAAIPSQNEISQLTEKAKQRVIEMKKRPYSCGAPFVTEQSVWGVYAPAGTILCQNSSTQEYKLVFPNSVLINDKWVMEHHY
jgi:hypothetical protein